jgi:hypothetical protein
VNLSQRIGKLERGSGGGHCPHGIRVVWPSDEKGAPPSLPATCSDCGLPRIVVRVVRSDWKEGGFS